MAKSPAERQREYLARKKDDAVLKSLSTSDIFKEPFHKFWGLSFDWQSFDLALALAGISTPTFDDDRGPESFVRQEAIDGLEPSFDPIDPFDRRRLAVAQGSLGRAEVMIDCLLDAALTLSDGVNKYKNREIRKRIADIEARDLSDPEIKKAAFKDMTRLNKMLDQLDKQVRWTFPEWKVTG